MEPLPKRFVLAVLAALALAGLSVGGYTWLGFRPPNPTASTPGFTLETVAAKETASDAILSELLADDYADAEELEYYDRAAVRQALLAEERHATGKRAVAVAYLLAALDEDYTRHRDIVVAALQARLADPTEDDDAIEYAISLCMRGDATLQQPLLAAGLRCAGETAELLGSFYAELIASDVDGFLDALSLFQEPEQCRIADLMAASLVTTTQEQVSDEVFEAVLERLEQRAKYGKPRLRAVAKRCLAALDRELSDDTSTFPSHLARD
ncbi:MAG: hypothetical protein SNJ67_01715 [Chloracidobacterium sp.]